MRLPHPSHRQRYTMQAFGQDVAAVVNQIGARKVILVGHSMLRPQAAPVVVEEIASKFLAADPKVGVSAMYELFDWNARQASSDLKRFSDILYNVNAAPKDKGLPPNSHVVMVPGVGHFVAQVKPGAFNQALESIIPRLNRTDD